MFLTLPFFDVFCGFSFNKLFDGVDIEHRPDVVVAEVMFFNVLLKLNQSFLLVIITRVIVVVALVSASPNRLVMLIRAFSFHYDFLREYVAVLVENDGLSYFDSELLFVQGCEEFLLSFLFYVDVVGLLLLGFLLFLGDFGLHAAMHFDQG